MELSNSIIDKICANTKFKYNGNYFVLYLDYFYGIIGVEIKVNIQVKTKIINIDENGAVTASIFIVGYKGDRTISFKNLDEYICYLNDKETSLNNKIGNKLLDDFMNNILD